MRRFIAGLLATLGSLPLLTVVGSAVFLYSGPFAAKSLPKSMVLSLDLRDVPPETISTDVLRGNLWRGSRDITEIAQTLWQAAEDPRGIRLYGEIGGEAPGLARVQEIPQAIPALPRQGQV